MEAVRDVERRIQLAEVQSKAHPLPSLQGPGGIPAVFSEYYKLMADMMVLAWQTDMTRVTTFQIGHEMSGRAYPEIGFGDSRHSVTHHPAARRPCPASSAAGWPSACAADSAGDGRP